MAAPNRSALAAQLRHKITIERASVVRDAFGDPVETWSTLATTYAAIEPLLGRELFAAGQLQADTTIRVRCRYSTALDNVTAKDRIVFEGRIFLITTPPIVLDMRRQEIHLMCRESDAD